MSRYIMRSSGDKYDEGKLMIWEVLWQGDSGTKNQKEKEWISHVDDGRQRIWGRSHSTYQSADWLAYSASWKNSREATVAGVEQSR